jgi:pimeloyl-ACP methyl ester carboxylesterase
MATRPISGASSSSPRRAALRSPPAIPDAAAAMLSSALALWRGPALEEFAEPFAVRERARLESLRLAALEDRIEAELARGAHADLTAELDALVVEHPQRERLRGQHMLALYRSGRQAEALASYQAAWQHLDKELGIQPSRALRVLEQRILAQDPTLVVEPQAAATPAAPVEDRSVRYAVNGGVSLAYQVYGSGRAEIVLVAGWVLPMELFRDDPGFAAFLDRLGEAARVLVWDKRGTGLSDRVSPASLPTLEERMGDLRAVMDAAGFARPEIVGLSEGTHLALMLAATHPERVRALALYGGWACSRRSADYPWGATQEEDDKLVELVREHWGDAAQLLRIWAPESQHDPALRAWWARALRLGATPTAAEIWLRMMEEIDLRAVLPSIRVPTVVIHRRGDVIIPVGNGRYMGEAIPGAQYVELPGHDHLWWVGDQDAILDPIVALVGDEADDAVPERVLATILAIRTPVGAEAEVRDQVERHGGAARRGPRGVRRPDPRGPLHRGAAHGLRRGGPRAPRRPPHRRVRPPRRPPVRPRDRHRPPPRPAGRARRDPRQPHRRRSRRGLGPAVRGGQRALRRPDGADRGVGARCSLNSRWAPSDRRTCRAARGSRGAPRALASMPGRGSCLLISTPSGPTPESVRGTCSAPLRRGPRVPLVARSCASWSVTSRWHSTRSSSSSGRPRTQPASTCG